MFNLSIDSVMDKPLLGICHPWVIDIWFKKDLQDRFDQMMWRLLNEKTLDN